MISEFQVFMAAMLPLGELRASIPIALTVFRLDWFWAYFISVMGNLTAVFLILLSGNSLLNFTSKRNRISRNFLAWLFERTKKRYNNKMEKYGYLSLIAFVAMPLPMTGGWTAALIAVLLGIPFRKSFPLISLGVMIAGLIVLLVSYLGITVEKYFGWQTLIGVFLAIGFGWVIFNFKNKKI